MNMNLKAILSSASLASDSPGLRAVNHRRAENSVAQSH